MFESRIYIERRKVLKQRMGSGVLLFVGNEESPMNYADNVFSFRQDSSFLYYWGIDSPGIVALIDVDDEREIIFGNDLTVDDIVWTGSQPTIAEKSLMAGVDESARLKDFEETIGWIRESGRKIHFLPQYRGENIIKLHKLLELTPDAVNANASIPFIKAVVVQRSVKSEEEIGEIEIALEITHAMHVAAMKKSRPGVYERDIAGMMEGVAYSMGGRISFPIIFSIHGETLHNHYHGNIMKKGDIVVNDSGAESSRHYAGDITRTIPIGGKFSQQQREIYQIVSDAQEKAIEASQTGVEFRNVHLLACKHLAAGLKELGLMKGDVDEAVQAGAHALFFQCGLGHAMGLDVHDMEGLGEQYVGYTDAIKRSSQFGLRSLRMAKALEPGFVVTVEPGIYLIPELIDRWSAEKKFTQYINYSRVEEYRNFGGIRVEDNILITKEGNRILGKPIPKAIDEVEALASE
jgi:Xaa-Pro aminopeptidase